MADAKITALTELTSVADADLLPIVDDVAGTPITKKATVANVAAQVVAGRKAAGTDVVTGTSDALIVTPLAAQALINTSGWLAAGETWTYASADDPTFTFTVNADVTAKYSPGMRVKLTQTTDKYFIITAVSSYSGGNTTITVYGGTDYDLANATITSPYFSTQKAPVGFPLDPTKWSVVVTDTGDRVTSSPTQNTWYNYTQLNITLPIGIWNVTQVFNLYADVASGTSAVATITLSNANNTEGDKAYNLRLAMVGATARIAYESLHSRSNIGLSIASKTAYYTNIRTTGSGHTAIGVSGSSATSKIIAVSAYL